MSHSPFISVIMPVYNAERYLVSAIEGVLKQSFKDLELILVDDCSNDDSGRICDDYANRDKRVFAIHLEQNGGAGNARNRGIEQAGGQYITFVDADDEIDSDLYSRVYEKTNQYQSDVVVWGLVEDYYDKNDKLVSENTIVFDEMLCDNKKQVKNTLLLLEEKTLLGYQWNKAYKAELIKQYHIRFEDAILYEDYFFNIDFMKHAKSIYVFKEAFYHYKKRMNDSITTKFIPEYFKLSYRRVKTLYILCQKWNVEKEMVDSILGTIYLRYILSALMRNSDSRSQKSYLQQKCWIRKVAEDSLYQNLSKNASVNNKVLRVLQKLLNSEKYGICVLIGKSVCTVKKITPVVFSLVKRNK